MCLIGKFDQKHKVHEGMQFLCNDCLTSEDSKSVFEASSRTTSLNQRIIVTACYRADPAKHHKLSQQIFKVSTLAPMHACNSFLKLMVVRLIGCCRKLFKIDYS